MKKILSCFIAAFLLINIIGGVATFAETSVVITSKNPGNIFSDNEIIEFAIEVDGVQTGDTAQCIVQNKDTKENIYSSAIDAKAEMTLVIPLDKNGNYTLKVSVLNSNGIETGCGETVFSRVMSGRDNKKFRHSAHFDAYKATIAEQFAVIDKANAGGYRDHPTGWPVYEHRNGDITQLDYVLAMNEEVAEHGITSNISIPHQGCEKYTGSTEIPPTETDDLEAWGRYSADLLKTTGAQKAEIWNEPNGNPKVTPQIYVNMVKASADAIKNYDKTIEVGACSLANPNGSCPNGEENCDDDSYEHWKNYGKCYFYDLVECGLLDLDIDAITIHSYMTDVYEMPKGIKWFRDFLDSRGRHDIEIWITEYGWYTGTAETAVSENKHANILVREYLQIMSADLAEDMTQYNLSNKYDRANNIRELSEPEHNFGVVQAQFDEFSETGVAFSAKQSYIALAAMNALMADAIGKDEVHFYGDESEIAMCDFTHSDGDDITAFFSDDKYDLSLISEAENLTVYDFYGNAEVIYPTDGKFSIYLDENVTYVKGELGEYSISDNTFAISDEADLISFRNYVNAGNTSLNAVLKNNIALSGTWTPIGTAENKYSGIFDGNGYEITNIKGSGDSNNAWGLFAYTSGGEIRNLTLSTGSESATAIGHQAALFVGVASDDTKITKCAGYGDVSGWGHIGGITYSGACIVENCYYSGSISGAHNVSGMGMGAVATNCFVYGNIQAVSNAFKVANTKATSNSYYLSSTGGEGNYGYGDIASEEYFETGELTALLNRIAGEEIYGQIIGEDVHSVFADSTNLLYQTADQNSYMNNPSGKAVICIKDGYVEILSPETKTGYVLICRYEEGTLESVACSNVTAESRIQTKIPFTGTGSEVKVFFWQGLNTLEPLAESI